MRQDDHGWISIVGNILDVIAASVTVALVVAILLADAPAVAARPLQDSTLVLPGIPYGQTSAIPVNRTLRADRVRRVLLVRPRSDRLPSSQIAPAPPERIPPGCDPAFSPIADPARAHVYKRCMA